MKKRGKFVNAVKIFVSLCLVCSAAFCVASRFSQCFKSNNPAMLAAAAFTLAGGDYKIEKPTDTSQDNSKGENKEPQNDASSATQTVSSIEKNRDKSDYYDSFGEHNGEVKYEIAENNYSNFGTQVDKCFIKNKTGLDLDFNSLLTSPLTFNVKKNTDSPQVLIYHTHTSESYIDEDVDFFYSGYYSRTQNTDFNVVAVGEAITSTLKRNGISVVHDKTVHDSTYNGSYDRSVQTVESNMDKYKDIKVVLDIHRDAIGTEECKIKPVFTYKDKKAAQIMILSGCDTDGERGFENWQNNLNFALKIQNTAEKMYPGMTRPISFDYFAYNEYVCDGSLLIEVGTEANSIDEAVYAGQLLGNVLSEVFK